MQTQARQSRARTDIQWILSSVSLAITLGLWGIFASGQKKVAGVAGEVQVVDPPDPAIATTSQPQMLLPGQVLLLGGTSPEALQSAQAQQPAQTVVTTRTRSKGSGRPAASTHSSHP